MTASRIRFEHHTLDDIAGRFTRAADDNRAALGALEQAKQTLQSGDWLGSGARAFYGEMDGQVLPAMRKLVEALAAAAAAATRISGIAAQAETDAAAALRPGASDTHAAPATAHTPTPALPGMQWGINQALAALASRGPKALRSAASTGIPIASLVTNAIRYRAADVDGSFDWSRYAIAVGKDAALGALKAPLTSAIAAGLEMADIGAGATIGFSLGGIGAAPGAAAGAAGGLTLSIPLAPLAATAVITAVDAVWGDQIVNGIDDVYQRAVRPWLWPTTAVAQP